ncbi:MAG TPA: TauD/TfdA family dioxygenase [Nevskiaceae bacterium]|nr:TauD/TfdA family dioxygenase [Nevskiaceae bacterium]
MSQEIASQPMNLPDNATYLLSPEENVMLAEVTAQRDNLRGPAETVTDYALRIGDRQLIPTGLASAMSDFAANGNKLGGMLVRGFEIDVDGPDPARAKAVGELILLSIAMTIGKPYGYASQRNGEIIQNLTPNKADALKQLGTGSTTTLEWHTEDAHTPLNCDVIALLCMRGAVDANTLISKVEPAELDESVRRELEAPNYVIISDGSYGSTSRFRTPIIAYDKAGNPEVRYDPLYTKTATKASKTALDALTAHVNARAMSINLEKGDLLLVDNGPSVHARSPFKPKYDGKDRWLQRVGVLSKDVPADAVVPGNQLVINI